MDALLARFKTVWPPWNKRAIRPFSVQDGCWEIDVTQQVGAAPLAVRRALEGEQCTAASKAKG